MPGFSVALFADGNPELVERSQRLSALLSDRSWCDEVRISNLEILSHSEIGKKIQDLARREGKGLGLWAWKPLVIHQLMSEVKYGDKVMYLDTGVEVADSVFNPISEILNDSDISVFETRNIERDYTHKKVFDALIPNSEVGIADTFQIKATIILIRKTSITEKLVSEWLALSSRDDFYLLKDEDGSIHRHDQSIFSVLVKLYVREYGLKIKLFKERYSLSPYLVQPWFCNRLYSLLDAKNRSIHLRYSPSIFFDLISLPTLFLNGMINKWGR